MLPRCFVVPVVGLLASARSILPRLSEPGLWLDSDAFYLGSLGPSGGHERFLSEKARTNLKKDKKDGKGC